MNLLSEKNCRIWYHVKQFVFRIEQTFSVFILFSPSIAKLLHVFHFGSCFQRLVLVTVKIEVYIVSDKLLNAGNSLTNKNEKKKCFSQTNQALKLLGKG